MSFAAAADGVGLLTAGSKAGSLELWDQDAVCRAAASAGVIKLRPPPAIERRSSASCESAPRQVLGTLLEVRFALQRGRAIQLLITLKLRPNVMAHYVPVSTCCAQCAQKTAQSWQPDL